MPLGYFTYLGYFSKKQKNSVFLQTNLEQGILQMTYFAKPNA